METGEIIELVEYIATSLKSRGYTLLANKYLRKIQKFKNNSNLVQIVPKEEASILMVNILEDLYKLAESVDTQKQMLDTVHDILTKDNIAVEFISYKTDFQEIQRQLSQFNDLMPNITPRPPCL
ncbi:MULTISPECIES: hypothetical protein [Peribacillus]|uniref:hypothetical protein n=1 Tax=Peribacillus TaxID=2675229 RepID=UPI000BA529BB|nr:MULTISPECIES: hypothetical protein [Peribacillus]MCY9139685.1 hypothetical protein [Peribacillus frigoritolerans]PAK41054.1 hypothetical protein CHI08_13335 [Peribacillus simplex]